MRYRITPYNPDFEREMKLGKRSCTTRYSAGAGRMTAWRWVRADLTYAVHDRQLAEHLKFDPADAVGTMEIVAAGALDEVALAE